MTASDNVHDAAIERLSRVAKTFVEDYPPLIKDDKASRAGQALSYAVDFSELFSYVFLRKLSMTSRGGGENFVLSVGFNEMVLHELLFSGRYQIQVLPAHELELQQLRQTILEREIGEIAEIYPAVVENLTLSDSLLASLRQFEADPQKSLNDHRLISNIINGAAQDAPSILLLARSAKSGPRARLRRVLSDTPVSVPRGPLQKGLPTTPVKEAIVSKAMDAFTKLRKDVAESTNLVDAKAVAQLSQIIENSEGRPSIRFVTRSKTFRRVCVSLAARKVVPSQIKSIIRHPRAFSAYVLANGMSRPASSFLEEYLQASQLFLSAVRKQPTTHIVSIEEARALDSMTKETEQVAILSSLVESSEKDDLKRMGAGLHDVVQLVSLLRDTAEVRRAFRARTQEVVDRLGTGTLDIAGDIATSQAEQHTSLSHLEVDVQPKGLSNSSTATNIAISRFNYAPVPYSLQFYNRQIAEWLSEGESAYEALLRFIRSMSTPENFERRLATAYILGLSEDWPLSLGFANAALNEGLSGGDKTPRHEGYYFRAVARRFGLSWTKQNILASWDDIVRAQKIKGALQPGAENDPRYLNERANILFQMQRAHISPKNLPGITTEDDAVAIWRRILRTEASLPYKLNALNNITFYYVKMVEVERAGEALRSLLDFIQNEGFKFENLSPAVQDTILEAKLFTGAFSTETEIAEAQAALVQIRANHPYVRQRPTSTEQSAGPHDG